MPQRTKNKIDTLTLKNRHKSADGLIARDQNAALRDLKATSVFQPAGDEHGPYDLTLSIEENRLVFRILNCNREKLPMLVLSLKPYRRLIKDYFMVVESYNKALREASPSKVEAIDMGRRGLHNEGAELLKDRLQDKIKIDIDTARRLFTLICALHAGALRPLG